MNFQSQAAPLMLIVCCALSACGDRLSTTINTSGPTLNPIVQKSESSVESQAASPQTASVPLARWAKNLAVQMPDFYDDEFDIVYSPICDLDVLAAVYASSAKNALLAMGYQVNLVKDLSPFTGHLRLSVESTSAQATALLRTSSGKWWMIDRSGRSIDEAIAQLPKCAKLPGIDLSSVFKNIRAEHIREARRVLKDTHFIFVGGMFLPELDQMRQAQESGRGFWPLIADPGTAHIEAAFADQVSLVKSWGATVEVILPRTFDAPRSAIPLITQALQNSSRPVVIFSQSKGGMAVLKTLLARTELQSKVVGWVANASPFRGKKILGQLASTEAGEYAVEGVAGLVGGEANLAFDFIAPGAGPLFESEAYGDLMRRVPVVSTIDPNDVAVKIPQGILPGSIFVELPPMPDHGSLIQGTTFRGDANTNRTALTYGLLSVLVSQMKAIKP